MAKNSGDPLSNSDIAKLLEAELRKLDPRAQQVLALRLFADEPVTLQELGRTWGVGREWIRQLERRWRYRMAEITGPGGQLGVLCNAIREAIGVALPLEVLLSAAPGLSCFVEIAKCPAWRVIERLDYTFEIKDGWCACPSVKAARELTLSDLENAAGEVGVVALDALMSPSPRLSGSAAKHWRVAWLEYCGVTVHGNEVVAQLRAL